MGLVRGGNYCTLSRSCCCQNVAQDIGIARDSVQTHALMSNSNKLDVIAHLAYEGVKLEQGFGCSSQYLTVAIKFFTTWIYEHQCSMQRKEVIDTLTCLRNAIHLLAHTIWKGCRIRSAAVPAFACFRIGRVPPFPVYQAQVLVCALHSLSNLSSLSTVIMRRIVERI